MAWSLALQRLIERQEPTKSCLGSFQHRPMSAHATKLRGLRLAWSFIKIGYRERTRLESNIGVFLIKDLGSPAQKALMLISEVYGCTS